MHLSYTLQCTIQNRNVHISVLNGESWDMGQGHCGIRDIGLLTKHLRRDANLLFIMPIDNLATNSAKPSAEILLNTKLDTWFCVFLSIQISAEDREALAMTTFGKAAANNLMRPDSYNSAMAKLNFGP